MSYYGNRWTERSRRSSARQANTPSREDSNDSTHEQKLEDNPSADLQDEVIKTGNGNETTAPLESNQSASGNGGVKTGNTGTPKSGLGAGTGGGY
jgi:hypothetical protein